MGTVIWNADAAQANLPIPATGRPAVHGKTLAVRAFFAGRTLDTHAVLPDTAVLEADLILLADPGAAQLAEALTACAAHPIRAFHAHAVGVDALTLVANLAVVRTIAIRAVYRVAPTVGAQEPGLAGHVDTGTPLANAVDAHLPLPEAARIDAIGGIAETTGAALSLGAAHTHAVALHAFLVYADLPVARALLGLAVDWITLPGRAALSLRTGHIHATGRQALLVNANLSHARAVPPYAIFRVAFASGAGSTLRAVPVQTGNLHAGIILADESLGTVANQAVEGQALAAHDYPVLALLVMYGPGGARGQHAAQASR